MTNRRLIFWILLAFALCLLPSGWLTGLEGTLLPGTKGESKTALLWSEAKEPLAHGLLMLAVGYSLMRLFSAGLVTGGPDLGQGDGDHGSIVVPAPAEGSLPQVSEVRRPWFLRSWGRCASTSILGVMVIAVLIEGTQALLPSSFSRGYALGDLGASLVGGFTGTLLATVRAWGFLPGRDRGARQPP